MTKHIARPLVSIIIPAFDAEDTLARTLGSVRDQFLTDWECIVIDDGSSDDTARVASELATLDPRLSVLRQENAGVSAARNAGIARARGTWVHFLDADDTISPAHLAALVRTAGQHEKADLIYCDWRHVGADGAPGYRHHVDVTIDPFGAFARNCAFPVHAAITRTEALRAVGGYDPALRMCEDWDLWQRLARTGFVFRKSTDALAEYLLVAGSASANHLGFLAGATTVISRGHATDPRLRGDTLAPPAPAEELPNRLTAMAFWLAGRAIGAGQDAAALLAAASFPLDLRFDAATAAAMLMDGFAAGSGKPSPDWAALWPDLRPVFLSLLERIEPAFAMPDFVRLTLREAERKMIQTTKAVEADIGATALRRFDRDAPASDLVPAPGIDRLAGYCGTPGAMLGRFEIPVTGRIPAARLRELIDELPTVAEAPSDVAAGQPAAGLPGGSGAIMHCDGPSPYDILKLEQTLAAIPGRPERALELGCGGGHLTARLAGRVGHLFATELSQDRLDRVRPLCAPLANVTTAVLDPARDLLPEAVDLVVCRDAFCRFGTADDLALAADRISECLAPSGHLVAVHDLLRDDLGATRGFAGDHRRFGAASVDAVLARCKGLELIEDRASPMYHVSVYRRHDPALPKGPVAHITLPVPDDLPAHVSAAFDWAGHAPARFRQDPPGVPVLMYHRICDDPAPALARYATSPAAFSAQMEWLKKDGYTTITTEDFANSLWEGKALPERPVLVTFDDGYHDNLLHAVPALRRLGMTATIFIPTDHVGGTADWDRRFAPPAPLMGWQELAQVQKAGLDLASHNSSHRPMTALSSQELRDSTRLARQMLRAKLGIDSTTLAYPFGIHDQAVERMLIEEGYRVGFTTLSRRYRKGDRIMAVPRIEVRGGMALDHFAATLRAV